MTVKLEVSLQQTKQKIVYSPKLHAHFCISFVQRLACLHKERHTLPAAVVDEHGHGSKGGRKAAGGGGQESRQAGEQSDTVERGQRWEGHSLIMNGTPSMRLLLNNIATAAKLGVRLPGGGGGKQAGRRTVRHCGKGTEMGRALSHNEWHSLHAAVVDEHSHCSKWWRQAAGQGGGEIQRRPRSKQEDSLSRRWRTRTIE